MGPFLTNKWNGMEWVTFNYRPIPKSPWRMEES